MHRPISLHQPWHCILKMLKVGHNIFVLGNNLANVSRQKKILEHIRKYSNDPSNLIPSATVWDR